MKPKTLNAGRIFLFAFSLFLFIFLFSSSTTYAANPTTPISPSDNIQDPGDPSTDWGGCGPTDSNCYVAGDWTKNGTDLYYTGGNVGIGTDTPTHKLEVNGTLKVTGSSSLADITPDTAASSTSGIVKNTIEATDGTYGLGMALGSDGFARIAYIDGNTTALKYARCDDADCSSPTITEVVSDTYGVQPGSQIMTLGSDNFARILYNDADTGYINFVRCLDTDCATKNINQIAADTAYYGQTITMGNDGLPRIVYAGYDNDYDVHVIRCIDADCASVVDTDTGGDTGDSGYAEVAMAIGTDGFARITYMDGNDDILKMIRCTDADCTSPVITSIDDSESYNGYYGMVIKFGSDGFPRIAYIDYDSPIYNYPLKYAVCTDADCTTPTITTLTSTYGDYDSVGFGMDLRPGNLASIALEDPDNGYTHLLNCTNNSCSTSTDVTIDTTNSYGIYYGASVVIGNDNLPRIAYADDGNDYAVHFARLGTLDGSDIASGNDIGSSGSKFNRIYGQTINADHLLINGSEFTGGQWTTSGSDIYFNDGNVGIGTTSPLNKLYVPGYNTINSIARIGDLELSSYSVNNNFIGSNLYYLTNSFIRRNTGYGGLLYFQGDEGQYRFFDTGVAGSSAGNGTTQLKISRSGEFGVGPSISNLTGNFTGANFYVGASGTARLSGAVNTGAGLAIGDTTDSTLSLRAYGDSGTNRYAVLGVNIQEGGNRYDAAKQGGGVYLDDRTGIPPVRLVYQPAGGNPTTGLSLASTGNVGIGTIDPHAFLDVASPNTVTTSQDLLRLNHQGAYDLGAESQLTFAQNTADVSRISNFYEGGGGSLWGLKFYTYASGLNASPAITVSGHNQVGIGTTSPEAKLEVAGSGCFDSAVDTHCTAAGTAGDIYYGTAHANWTDIAEKYPSNQSLESGDVVMLDTTSIEGASIFKPYITKAETGGRVMGVISEHPGLVLGDDYGKSEDYSLALSGRVPVKVTDENGTIQAGDRLTLSLTQPGYAMKQTQAGQSFGIALEQQTDQDTILMFVDLSYQSLADLNLEGSDAPVVPDGGMLAIVSSWLSDTGNGITKIFAGEVDTKKLCVSDDQGQTCITRGELDALLGNSAQNSQPQTLPANDTPEETTPPQDEVTPPADSNTPETTPPDTTNTDTPVSDSNTTN